MNYLSKCIFCVSYFVCMFIKNVCVCVCGWRLDSFMYLYQYLCFVAGACFIPLDKINNHGVFPALCLID